MWNPVLQQYCGSIARLCCSNIAAIGCQKPCILVRENLFALLYYEKFGWGIKKKLLAVYCKLTFVAKNLIGPLSCDCKNACVFHSRQPIWRMCWHNNFWQQIIILWLFLIKALDRIKKYMFLRHCISVGPKRLVTTVVFAVARIVILSRLLSCPFIIILSFSAFCERQSLHRTSY